MEDRGYPGPHGSRLSLISSSQERVVNQRTPPSRMGIRYVSWDTMTVL